MKKILIIILLSFLIINPSFAQQGPIIQCVDCIGLNNKAYPVSGSWFNPDQSGTGYILDVKKGYVSGLYFGYSNEGKALWLSFQGELQPSDESGVNWKLNAPMIKVSGGNAFNQEYQFPDLQETGDKVQIDFHFAHYASVKVNQGEVQHIIPTNFAVPTDLEFEETDLQFPELEGMWTFVMKMNDSSGELGLKAYWGYDFYITPKGVLPLADDRTKTLLYTFNDASTIPETVNFASLFCQNSKDLMTGARNVNCWINNLPNITDNMVVAPGNIGPNYIYAENERGDVFEARRVNYLPNWGLPPLKNR